MSFKLLVIKLNTFEMNVHIIKSLSMNESGTMYEIVEADGSQTIVSKEDYLLTILK